MTRHHETQPSTTRSRQRRRETQEPPKVLEGIDSGQSALVKKHHTKLGTTLEQFREQIGQVDSNSHAVVYMTYSGEIGIFVLKKKNENLSLELDQPFDVLFRFPATTGSRVFGTQAANKNSYIATVYQYVWSVWASQEALANALNHQHQDSCTLLARTLDSFNQT